MSFFSLGLSKSICDHLESVGFVEPTPIQTLAIPLVLSNCDIMASAQTGTGKTGGFLLPIIDFLVYGRKKNRLPRVLILEPTRELAIQVYEQFLKFYNGDALKAVVLVGGESNILQERALTQGIDLVIATPGRLMDLYERQKIMLHDIKTLVIDEADRMLDMGFIPDIDRLTKALPPLRQSLLFSATFNDEIEKLGNLYLMNPRRLTAERVNQTASTITQYVCYADVKNKDKTIEYLLNQHITEQSIIFCNRKSDILKLIAVLQRKGFSAIDLHGDLTQMQRNQRLDEFRADVYKVLVASDVAARGIDIPDLGVVINYDIPLQAQDYVHRIGRTGRANQKGISYSLATPKEEKKIKEIEQLIRQPINVMEPLEFIKDIKESRKEKSKAPKPIKMDNEEVSKEQKDSKRENQRTPKPRYPKAEKEDHSTVGFGNFVPAFMLRQAVVTMESPDE